MEGAPCGALSRNKVSRRPEAVSGVLCSPRHTGGTQRMLACDMSEQDPSYEKYQDATQSGPGNEFKKQTKLPMPLGLGGR